MHAMPIVTTGGCQEHIPSHADLSQRSTLHSSSDRLQLSYFMAGYSYFVCPVEYNSDTNRFAVDCVPPDLFQLQEYHIPAVIQSFIGWKTVWMYPFQIHSIALSTFASLIGPFGGFFASGFKRAFKIKTFGAASSQTVGGKAGIEPTYVTYL
ncbi:hypothetical protein AB205_0142210 [Aquarana catesbeiana]|uniref:phosphatidate cytidylyltransferase n=1 Tax=Aquarana catesbeiana TaxID=8400 RepID=A0A2G9SFE2_AQUCT|nr:hypothetical protein AB205_0142210 [Aquarana catesbeiana]